MASAVVRDSVVRNEFERIAWVSVGQTPAVVELQRVLYQQLKAEPMPVKDGANAATQLEDLQTACIGQRWLVVLDDVWEKKHEKQLSCVDTASASKLLVTTRIRYAMSTLCFNHSTARLLHCDVSLFTSACHDELTCPRSVTSCKLPCVPNHESSFTAAC
jgi:hypothetical protein